MQGEVGFDLRHSPFCVVLSLQAPVSPPFLSPAARRTRTHTQQSRPLNAHRWSALIWIRIVFIKSTTLTMVAKAVVNKFQ